MAIPTGVRQILILIIEMALIARSRLMCTDELERRVRMIERRRAPHRGRMARRAILPETRLDMPRVCRLIVLRLMAREAVRVLQLVVVVRVAELALRCHVRARKRKARRGMVE
jgi:hypothetical protein